MNDNDLHPSSAGSPSALTLDAMQMRFALRITARLTEQSAALSPDLTERLRFAREKALERFRAARSTSNVASVGVTRSGAATFGRVGVGWWLKTASVLPVFVLVAGLLLIQRSQDNTQIATAAEVDAALLSDDLPPIAYSDAGFAEFLKMPGE